MAWELRFFGPIKTDPEVVRMSAKHRGSSRSDHYLVPLPPASSQSFSHNNSHETSSHSNLDQHRGAEGSLEGPEEPRAVVELNDSKQTFEELCKSIGIKIRGIDEKSKHKNQKTTEDNLESSSGSAKTIDLEMKVRLKEKKRGAEYWSKFYLPPIPSSSSTLHSAVIDFANSHMHLDSINKNDHMRKFVDIVSKASGFVSIIVEKEIYTKPYTLEENGKSFKILMEQTRIALEMLKEADSGTEASKKLEFFTIAFEINVRDFKVKGMAKKVYKVCEELFPEKRRASLGFSLDSYPSFLLKMVKAKEPKNSISQ